MPVELQREVKQLVEQTQDRSGWPVRKTLRALEIKPASYYRWRRRMPSAPLPSSVLPPDAPPEARRSIYEVLESERRTIVDYALKHPAVRHRELAWKPAEPVGLVIHASEREDRESPPRSGMVNEGVCGVSSSTVYRVLKEAKRVCGWKPEVKAQGSGKPPLPTKPDELWQTDIRYTKVGGRNYYLLSFIDVYSRYVTYHELLRSMDGKSVSVAAASAIERLPAEVRPTIQSDHGSGFIAREFASTLAEAHVGTRPLRGATLR